MTRGSRERASRTFALIALVSAVWAIAVTLTGGVGFESGPIRLTSRTPRNPAIVAAFSAALAWTLATPDRRRSLRTITRTCAQRAVTDLLRLVNGVPSTLAPALTAAAVAAVLWAGLAKGTHVAGGSDSYGYVSQADLWAHGTLRTEQPLMDQLTWPAARAALAPLGYRPARTGAAIVPVYAPGLPMVMALFLLAAGRSAVFYVVPALGGLAIWATYLMGRRLAGRAVGLVAAILLATSPAFLYQLMQPMSDVPAAAWWALALALLASERQEASLIAGLSAGLAVLTRANLAPLPIVIGAFLLQRIRTERALSGRAARGAALFAAGTLPGCLAVLALNAHWYGSALDNGYGRFTYLYELANLGPNLARYPRWLLESQTPIVLLAFAAPFLLKVRLKPDPTRDLKVRPKPDATGNAVGLEPVVASGFSRTLALMWLAFAATVLGCYVFYAPFDAWWYLRFLLPAFPAMSVLTAAALVILSARLAGRAHRVVVAAVVAAVAWHGVAYARNRSAFDLRDGERKYVAVGEYIAARLPERAALLSIQHSGSARYYSGRVTIRYDRIEPAGLDSAIEDLRRLGYEPYFLLEDDEEADFRARFGGGSRLGRLDWPPVAKLRRNPGVKIYDAADGRDSASRPRGATDIIDEGDDRAPGSTVGR